MFKIQTAILSKQGKSNTNWRQVTMLTNDDESQFEIHEYYGQKKVTYAKEVLRLKFDSYSVAIMNFINIRESRVIDGYKVVESLCEKCPFMPFIKFKPPVYAFQKKEQMVESLARMEEPVAVPINSDGQRLYIRFGHEALSSIVAQDYRGENVALKEDVAKRILTTIKIGQFENGIIEAYVQKDNITIMDIISLNGEQVHMAFLKRIAYVKSIFGYKGFSYPETINPRIEKDKLNARHYIVKDNENGAFGGLVIPNFYSVSVVVMGIKKGYRQEVKVFFSTDEDYTEIGTFFTDAQIIPGTTIQIAFQKTKNGLPVNFWLSPIQPQDFYNYDEDKTYIEQMNNLESHWFGL